jgi:hypothetical protein
MRPSPKWALSSANAIEEVLSLVRVEPERGEGHYGLGLFFVCRRKTGGDFPRAVARPSRNGRVVQVSRVPESCTFHFYLWKPLGGCNNRPSHKRNIQ